MPNQQNNDPNQRSNQQGAPQNTQDMPSSGNSPNQPAGTDEGMNKNSDVERSGGTGGTATQRSPQTGDPGRTPGKAEGVENPENQGNQ
jgi:hypothetical protein